MARVLQGPAVGRNMQCARASSLTRMCHDLHRYTKLQRVVEGDERAQMAISCLRTMLSTRGQAIAQKMIESWSLRRSY